MIPKVIHYCWFGGAPLPELAQKCIASWRKYCPDYEIREWNEGNFDVNCCAYAKEAYDSRKWAFVTDVARLYVLAAYGGIYMDTDVEVLRPLDYILEHEAVSGFEKDNRVPTGLMASVPDQVMIKELLHEYDDIHFLRQDGSMDDTTNVVRITNACLRHGLRPDGTLQTINGFTFLPKDYLCPKDCTTGEIHLTENSYAIHHFDGSWLSEEDRVILELTRKYGEHVPRGIAGYMGKLAGIMRMRGVGGAVRETLDWMRRKAAGLIKKA